MPRERYDRHFAFRLKNRAKVWTNGIHVDTVCNSCFSLLLNTARRGCLASFVQQLFLFSGGSVKRQHAARATQFSFLGGVLMWRNCLASLSAAAAVAVLVTCGQASAQLSNFSQDFESLDRTQANALSDFSVFAASSGGVAPDFGDFDFFIPVAPNNIASPNISVISDFPSGGNPPAGNQGLVLLADFPSAVNDPSDPRSLTLSLFGEQSIAAVDFGETVTFEFLAQGNSTAPTGNATVEAFLQILNPEDGFALVTSDVLDLTNLSPGQQLNDSLSIVVPNDPFLLAGDDADPNTGSAIVQFGFRNTSGQGDFAFIDADNLSLTVGSAPIPEPTSLALLGLAAAGLAARRRR